MVTANRSMQRGDSFAWNVAALTQAGAVIDMTGGTWRFTAKWNTADADNAAAFSLVVAAGEIVVISAALGTATINIGPSKTSSLPAHKFTLFYDVQATTSASAVYTIETGKLTVNCDVTRTTP